MDNNELREKWPLLKDKLKTAHPELTDEDLVYSIGQEGELLKRLQEKLKKNEEEIFYTLNMMG
ncbi:MAG: general stress protein CsbD [Taibaiella sp.]|nr:general stress protein CsbD [Taibaiella sp.]